MPAAQYRAARTLGHARRGLVRRSALDQLGAIWNSEALAVIQYGRAAARLIQFHFPASYAAYDHYLRLNDFITNNPNGIAALAGAIWAAVEQAATTEGGERAKAPETSSGA